jgi:hypothetical protein
MRSIDYAVRKAVAKWVRAVALEQPVDPIKAAIAKRMVESMSPATPAQDSALVHVVFLVRVALDLPEDQDPTPEAIDSSVAQIMMACGRIGAFQG